MAQGIYPKAPRYTQRRSACIPTGAGMATLGLGLEPYSMAHRLPGRVPDAQPLCVTDIGTDKLQVCREISSLDRSGVTDLSIFRRLHCHTRRSMEHYHGPVSHTVSGLNVGYVGAGFASHTERNLLVETRITLLKALTLRSRCSTALVGIIFGILL